MVAWETCCQEWWFAAEHVTSEESCLLSFIPEISSKVMSGIIPHLQGRSPEQGLYLVKLWDTEGCLMVGFLPAVEIIIAAYFVQTLQKLQCALHSKSLIKTHNSTWHCLTSYYTSYVRDSWKVQLGCLPPFTLLQSGLSHLRLPFVWDLEKDHVLDWHCEDVMVGQEAMHTLFWHAETDICFSAGWNSWDHNGGFVEK
jgi:hypothetical protein